MTWEQSSLKCIWDDMDLVESLEGEEGAATAFPLSCMWWDLVLSLLLVWEDVTYPLWKKQIFFSSSTDRIIEFLRGPSTG